MIKSNTSLFFLICLFVGGFILASSPLWLISLLSITALATLAFFWALKHPTSLYHIWQFCIEFLGFCLLVLLFVAMLAFMGSGISI